MRYIILALMVVTGSEAFAKEGRYQIYQLGSLRRDQYMIDTETGKLWLKTCLSFSDEPSSDLVSCSRVVWVQERVEGLTGTMKQIMDKEISVPNRVSGKPWEKYQQADSSKPPFDPDAWLAKHPDPVGE